MSEMKHIGETIRAMPRFQALLEKFPPEPPSLADQLGRETGGCDTCTDLGFVRRDVRGPDGRPDVRDPRFGAVDPCPRCTVPRLKQQRLERLFGELPGSRHWTLASCAAFLAEQRRAGHVFRPADLPETLTAWQADGGAWLWLYGEVGLMKTAFCAALARAEIEAGRTVAYRTVPRMLDRIKATFDSGESTEGVLGAVIDADIVLLDDLGKEKLTEFAAETVFKIVNERYIAQQRGTRRRTLVTSNLSWAEVIRRYDDSAVVDRIREMATPQFVIEVSGKSLRTAGRA